MTGINSVTEIGEEFAEKDIPHAMLWLFQSFALSAGMYRSQICSPSHIKFLIEATGRDQLACNDIHETSIGCHLFEV